jgi:hypothetical protein
LFKKGCKSLAYDFVRFVSRPVLERLERRRGERAPVDAESDDPPSERGDRNERDRYGHERRTRTQTVIHVADHQPKAQFVDIARKLLAAGLLDPLALELPEQYQDLPPETIGGRTSSRVTRRHLR